MGKILGVVLFLGTFLSFTGALLVEDVKDQVISDVDKAWVKLKTLDVGLNKPLAQSLKDLAAIVTRIPEAINQVERELTVHEYDEALKSLARVANTSSQWREKWKEIAVLTAPLDVLYGYFKIFPESPESLLPESTFDYDVNSLSDLILKPLYDTDEQGTMTLKYLVDNLHAASVKKTRRERDAFHSLNDHIEDALRNSYWCLWNGKTPQRVIYGLYQTLMLYDIKSYTLLNFAWMLKYVVNKTDSSGDVALSKESLLERTLEKTLVAHDVLTQASSGFWRCDPIKYQEGVNYAEFKELLQGYIENEKNMHQSSSCKQSCTDYTFSKARCPYPDDESCFKNRICTGNIVDCKYIAADATVCPADAPRRFDYIDYKRGPTLGTKVSTCSKPTEKRNSHWRFLYHCSNCFCLCDDPHSPTTVRHVSLAPAVSDITSNKLVTGVRFVMQDGILHLQIEEGEADKAGEVVDGTTDWKSLPSLNKHDETKVAILEYTRRNFDLDDLVVPKGHVVTGVRFRILGGHINLEIQATQLNPDTGKLLRNSHWISNDNTPEAPDSARIKLHIEEPDIPTHTKLPSIPDSVHDQYIQFGPSDRYKDVAQTTVPFIDLQEVRPNPPVWLRGIGVYHKGQPGYGGFLAPRVFTFPLTNFFQGEK